MSWPQQSDFSAPAPDAFHGPAWWTYQRDDGSQNVCALTGATLVSAIRSNLGLSDVPAWDASVQQGLIARAQQIAAQQPGSDWSGVISALQADLTARRVSMLSLQFGIWVAVYQQNLLRLDAIGLPAATPPPWGVALRDGAWDGGIVCFDPNSDPDPSGLLQDAFNNAESQSGSGVRLHPGEALPPPAQIIVPPPVGFGPGTWALIGLGVLTVGGVAAIVISRNKRARKRKRSR